MSGKMSWADIADEEDKTVQILDPGPSTEPVPKIIKYVPPCRRSKPDPPECGQGKLDSRQRKQGSASGSKNSK